MTTPNQVVSFFGTQGLTSETLYMNLFTNDVTIGAGTVAGSLTVATGGGYAEKTIAGTSWSGTVLSAEHCIVTLTEQTFTFSGTVGLVYGWAITDGAGLTGDLVAVGKFNEAQMIGDDGDAIAITVTEDMWIASSEVPHSVYVSQLLADNDYETYLNGSTAQTRGQSFTVPAEVTLYSIILYGQTHAGTCNATLRLKEGSPDLTTGYTEAIGPVVVGDTLQEHEFLFAEPRPTLYTATTYYFGVSSDATVYDNAFFVRKYDADVYGNGSAWISSATQWSMTEAATRELWFKVTKCD